MDAGIHSALVGGALGGVLGGVTTAWAVGRAQHLQGRHEARAKLEAAADELEELRHPTVEALTPLLAPDDMSNLMPQIISTMRQIAATTRLIRRYAWALGFRRAAAVRRAVDKLDAVLVWVKIRRLQGRDIERLERTGVIAAFMNVTGAVYGAAAWEYQLASESLPDGAKDASYEDVGWLNELGWVEPTWRAAAAYWWRRSDERLLRWQRRMRRVVRSIARR